MDKTGIEWTNATWNPLRGCTMVSDACDNCYAMSMAYRFSGEGQPYEGLARMTSKGARWTGEVMLVPSVLDQPIRWQRPRKIFVNSMSDLFHEKVSFDFIDQVFAVMALARHHTFQVLTKRPDRMAEYFAADPDELLYRWAQSIPAERLCDANFDLVHRNTDFPLPNVWLGVTVENQDAANGRIPLLASVPAKVRWLSCEPLLGPVDLSRWMYPALDLYVCQRCGDELGEGEDMRGDRHNACGGQLDSNGVTDTGPIDWVVAGGESGKGARPMHPNWARALRDECRAALVPFFFKQWGEWAPIKPESFCQLSRKRWSHDTKAWAADGREYNPVDPAEDHFPSVMVYRVGKRKSGSALDGCEHKEMPAPG